MSTRRFWNLLIIICCAGLAIRVGFVFGWKRNFVLHGDNFVYHHGANFLAEGKGLITPPLYLSKAHLVVPMADHPPGYWFYLAIFSTLGMKSILAHQLATCLLGGATVILAGILGKRLAGPRVGLIAAAFVACYAFLWINDALVMSETLAVVATAVMLLAAYDFLDRPAMPTAVKFGLACGVTAMCRAELLLFLPLVGLPLIIRAAKGNDRRWAFVKYSLAVGLSAAAVMAPWVARNLSTFKEPVYLSTGLGITLAYTNCDQTYYGELVGFLWFECRGPYPPGRDPSIDDVEFRKKAVAYIKTHKSRVPVVLAARVGRQWNLFRPGQQMVLDTYDDRNLSVSRLGLAQYYLLLPFAVAGALVLRRRRISIWPLIAIPVAITITAMLTYGMTRFRAPADMLMCVLAAVSVDVVVSGIFRQRRISAGTLGVIEPAVETPQT